MIGVQINHINGKIMAPTLLYHLLSNSIFSTHFDEKSEKEKLNYPSSGETFPIVLGLKLKKDFLKSG